MRKFTQTFSVGRIQQKKGENSLKNSWNFETFHFPTKIKFNQINNVSDSVQSLDLDHIMLFGFFFNFSRENETLKWVFICANVHKSEVDSLL